MIPTPKSGLHSPLAVLASSGCCNKIPHARQNTTLLGTEKSKTAHCLLHPPCACALAERDQTTLSKGETVFFFFPVFFPSFRSRLKLYIYLCVRACMCCGGQLTGVRCHLPHEGPRDRTQAFGLGDKHLYPWSHFSSPIFLFAWFFSPFDQGIDPESLLHAKQSFY